jgi:UDP-2,3-diacylglucosamine pyrophosphatase LpxH
MPFQADVISDLHANIWKMPDTQISSIFAARSPNLILAGDMGDPDEPHLYRILSLVQPLYKRIIYVPGNHEFTVREANSKKTPAAVFDWFRRLEEKWNNFYFFYRRTEVFDGVRIVGATAWTTSHTDTPKALFIAEEGRKDRTFLENTIAKAIEPTLVVTHYAPSFRLIQPQYHNTLYRLNYAQDLETLCHPPVKLWICGHIHQAHTLKIPYESVMYGSGHITLLCHPYGYPHEGIVSATTKQITVA